VNINATLIGQSITFFIFVWFCLKFIWPPIRNAMAEREQKIADGLQAADRAQRDLELAKEKVVRELHEAKQQASVIIEQANKRSAQIVDEAKQQAREEGDRLKVAAQAEIEQEVNRAREKLRSQVSTLAVAGAEKILQSSIDVNAHNKLVERLAAEL
jgi:F-type H+-transporting ATPase subunit b